MSKEHYPAAPEDLEGEALLEWYRVCEELDGIGRLAKTDRAIITLYCRTWAVHHAVSQHVAKFGAVIKWSNNVPGIGPWAKQMKESTAQLCKMLVQMGLTPSSRSISTAPAKTDELEF